MLQRFQCSYHFAVPSLYSELILQQMNKEQLSIIFDEELFITYLVFNFNFLFIWRMVQFCHDSCLSPIYFGHSVPPFPVILHLPTKWLYSLLLVPANKRVLYQLLEGNWGGCYNNKINTQQCYRFIIVIKK